MAFVLGCGPKLDVQLSTPEEPGDASASLPDYIAAVWASQGVSVKKIPGF